MTTDSAWCQKAEVSHARNSTASSTSSDALSNRLPISRVGWLIWTKGTIEAGWRFHGRAEAPS